MKTILRIAVVAAIASVLVMSLVNVQVFAAKNPPGGDKPGNLRPEFKWMELPQNGTTQTDSIKQVGLRAVFHFADSDEVVDSFNLFDTKGTGFDRSRGVANFVLQGVISKDKPMVYEAIDKAYYLTEKASHDFKIFDVDVMFTRASEPYRVLSYNNCIVKNYNIVTVYDRDETFFGKQLWTYLDQIEFECRGALLYNPTYEKLQAEKVKEATDEVLKNLKKD